MMTMITITTVMHNKIVFESNADHRRVRAFKDAWSLPVTWQRWRSHHSIRLIRKPHAAYANITALCLIERELLPIEVLHCENRNFRPFRLLLPWPWPNYLHIWTQPVVHGGTPRVQMWTSYVKAFESYRLTDIHTDRQDQNYYTRRFAVGKDC